MFPVAEMLQKEKIEQLGFGECLVLGSALAEGWMLCCVCTCGGGLPSACSEACTELQTSMGLTSVQIH